MHISSFKSGDTITRIAVPVLRMDSSFLNEKCVFVSLDNSTIRIRWLGPGAFDPSYVFNLERSIWEDGWDYFDLPIELHQFQPIE